MGIRFACHHCDHSLNIKQELAGRVGTCPDCRQRFRIPLTDSTHSLAVESEAVTTAPAVPSTPTTAAASGAIESQAPAKRELPATAAQSSPLDDAEAQWFVRPPAGGQYGPADGPTLRQWISEHRVTPGTLVWRTGWSHWLTAREALPDVVKPAGDVPPASAAGRETTASISLPTPANDGLVGDPAIGAVRLARSRKRLTVVTILGTISLALVLVLAFLALR